MSGERKEEQSYGGRERKGSNSINWRLIGD